MQYTPDMIGDVMMGHLNAALGGSNAEAYGRAQEVVVGASAVREAVEGLGILGRMTEAEVVEAEAVMRALPRAVELAILGAANAGFERHLPIGVEWQRGAEISVRIREDRNEVRIILTTPNGQEFL